MGRCVQTALSLALALLAPHACGGWQAPLAVPRAPAAPLLLCRREARGPRCAVSPIEAQTSDALPSLPPLAPPATAASNGHSAPAIAPTWEPAEELSPEREELRARLVAQSYEECKLITKQYAKTFYFGTSFFDDDKRSAIWAVYAWCRRLDDIVDKPRKDTSSLRKELEQWQQRLHDIWRGRAWDLLDLALVDSVQRYPGLTTEPFEDMIKGMVMDLDQNRFETFDELYLYCYRVAGTVGLMTMPIMGVAPGYTFEEALEPALALGVALQLTNILRDVGEDRVRQRIYLPQEDLRRFNISELSLLKGVKDEKYVEMLKFQIARARDWYQQAESGIPMLAEDARLPVRASLDMYGAILDKIEANGYDNFNKRAYTAKWEKLMMLPGSYLWVRGLSQ